MNRIKLLAVFFSISILFGCYFVENNGFLLARAQSLTQMSSQSNYQKPVSQISKSDLNLFISILNNLMDQLNKILNSQSLKKTDSIFTQKKSDESQKFFISGADNKNIGASNIVTINSVDNYYSRFLELTKNISFAQSEVVLMEKGDGGKRILTLEELLQKAANGYNLLKLKNSFLAWKNFDEKIIASLKTMPVGGAALSVNNSLINWLQYHSDIAKKLSEGNLSASQINDLYQQFKTKGAAQNLLMKNSTAQIKDSKEFSFVNSAQAALTCVPSGSDVNFGGMVDFTSVCDDLSELLIISEPCGGNFQLSIAVEAINPYFKGFIKMSDNILGKAKAVTTSCSIDGETYADYDASIIFYGASGGL